jgi:enoyl-CoA hydratase/carnithine racemase
MTGTILTETTGRVLVITLNRPNARNAINGELAVGVLEALARLDADDELAVGVLTGNGGFCSGMDLKAFAADGPPKGLDRLLRGVAKKPLVAAVERFALAGGLELALSCDLIVAGRSAKLGIPEVKVGLFAAGGGLLRLPRAMPERVAMELALTGEPITAEQAHAWGLVNRVVDDGDALPAGIDLATLIARNAPLGVAASKTLIYEANDLRAEEFWSKQADLFAGVSRTDDAKEGPAAFAEKRTPSWSGR